MSGVEAGSLLARLSAATPPRRVALLTEQLQQKIATKLAVEPWFVEPRRPLMDLGMSSLKAVELKLELERELGFKLRSSLLFDYPTLESLVPFILGRLAARTAAQPAAPAALDTTTPAPRCSEASDIEARLARALEGSGTRK